MSLSDRNPAGVLRAIPRALAVLAAVAALFPSLPAHAESCESVVHALNQRLSARVDEDELVSVLRSLNGSRDRKLPPKFVTKRQAKSLGWHPGKDLWASPDLRGKSIGGDRFNDRRMVTVDHYSTFVEVPACRWSAR